MQPDDPSKLRIMDLCARLGVDTDPRKLHSTLMYSPELAPEPDTFTSYPSRATAQCRKVEYFPGHNNAGYLVATLDSDDLQSEHLRLKENGAKHTYDPYKPHVTLASHFDMTDELDEAMQAMNMELGANPVQFGFDSYTVSDIKD
tara:strand:- start:51726 stop:52160 length:435 start_codon:yes stop_codon:yes gene_type:complete